MAANHSFINCNNHRPTVEIKIETHKIANHSNSFFKSDYKPTNSTDEITKIISFHKQLVDTLKEDDARIAVIVEMKRIENGLKMNHTFASLDELNKYLEENHYIQHLKP
ncbi:MAG TPA: hypothetical protein VL360_07695 [Gammaproteobacteria bacterium]|jgi:hypothetical protein|nr:hypothetical protein [Gammaproteobacteria bacterium]